MLFSNAALTKLWIACVDRVLLVRERAPTPAPRRPWQMRWKRRGAARREREVGCLGGAPPQGLAGRGPRLAPIALGGIAGGEQEQDFGLQRVGVLELVDEDALVDALQVGARGIVAQMVAGAEQEIQKIELPGAAFFLLIEAHTSQSSSRKWAARSASAGLRKASMATFNSSQAAERASRPLTQRISPGRRSNSLL